MDPSLGEEHADWLFWILILTVITFPIIYYLIDLLAPISLGFGVSWDSWFFLSQELIASAYIDG